MTRKQHRRRQHPQVQEAGALQLLTGAMTPAARWGLSLLVDNFVLRCSVRSSSCFLLPLPTFEASRIPKTRDTGASSRSFLHLVPVPEPKS